jgi:Holliday junction resolvase RusA-like endonuclease
MRWTATIPIVPPKTTAQMQRLLVVKGRAMAVKTAKHKEGMDAIGAYLEPPDVPLDGPLMLDVRIVWPYTKGDTQRKADRDREDLIWHTPKPDLDNWLKGFQDLLVSRKIIKDDCHIVWVIAQKLRGPDRLVGITVSIEEAGS